MNRYDIALKKRAPKRYVKKALKKLKQWWLSTSVYRQSLLNKILTFLRLIRRVTSEILLPRTQGLTGIIGSTGIQGYALQGWTGFQGMTGIQGYPAQGITGTRGV
jgi:hypothetical protein